MSPDPVIIIRGAPELLNVPEAVWRRLIKFLREGGDGQVVWHCKCGVVTRLNVNEFMAVDARHEVGDGEQSARG